MPDKTWESTEEDLTRARESVMMQYRNNSIEDFLENQIEVIASQHACNRFLNNIIEERYL